MFDSGLQAEGREFDSPMLHNKNAGQGFAGDTPSKVLTVLFHTMILLRRVLAYERVDFSFHSV